MKKSILILLVFLSALSINAQEPVIKIYMNDGSSKQYKINDIANLSFISSNLSYSMIVFQSKLNSKSDFDIKTIDSIEFENNQTMNIIQSGNTKSFIISEIDSIIFTFNTCTEIQIGNQVWMCRNLDVDHYRNGDSIRHAVSDADWMDAANKKEGAWSYYKNDPANDAVYGKLYNWYAVNDSRGLAPIGYHVPGDEEWTALETYIRNNRQYWCNNHSDYFTKSLASKEQWNNSKYSCVIGNNLNANNSSGFSSLPGGYRFNNGGFRNLRNSGHWWSETEFDDTTAWSRNMAYDRSDIGSTNSYKVAGFSVRCVRGDYTSDLKINSIIPTTAIIGDEIAISGTGFRFSKDKSFVSFNSVKPQSGDYIIWSDTEIIVTVPEWATSGKISVTVNGEKSNEVDFIVALHCNSDIAIGSQIWMCRNLDVSTYRNGDKIRQAVNDADWVDAGNKKEGAWCYYYNYQSNGAIYGKLYNWFAVNDSRGLAPVGYHIPSDEEWTILETSLRNDKLYWCNGNNNYIAKSLTSKVLWEYWNTTCAIGNNLKANNTSGFSALPGGFRGSGAAFYGLISTSCWWSSTEDNEAVAWYRLLHFYYTDVGRDSSIKVRGFSVRCVRD